MSQILYTNLNDRWSRFAARTGADDYEQRRALRKLNASFRTHPPPEDRSQFHPQSRKEFFTHLNRLPEPFTARDLFEAIKGNGRPDVSFSNVRQWITHRKREGQILVVEDKHRDLIDGRWKTIAATYRRARTPLNPELGTRNPEPAATP